jgi:hypothetical protein
MAGTGVGEGEIKASGEGVVEMVAVGSVDTSACLSSWGQNPKKLQAADPTDTAAAMAANISVRFDGDFLILAGPDSFIPHREQKAVPCAT